MVKHDDTLAAVFANPVRANLDWHDIEAMMVHFGAEVAEGSERVAGAGRPRRGPGRVPPAAPATRGEPADGKIGPNVPDLSRSTAVMQYKGYVGRVEFDLEAKVLLGQILGTRDVITFEVDAAADFEREFRASVDDYLAFRRNRGEPPEPPSGEPVAVRLPSRLYGQRARLAADADTSVDAIAVGLLTTVIDQK